MGEAAGRAFRKTATEIAARVPAVYPAAGVFLSDTHDRLNLCHDDIGNQLDVEHQAPPNYLHPHL